MDISKVVLDSIKNSSKHDCTKEVSITVGDLCDLNPHIPRDELLNALIDLPGVAITNTTEGGIKIPHHLF